MFYASEYYKYMYIHSLYTIKRNKTYLVCNLLFFLVNLPSSNIKDDRILWKFSIKQIWTCLTINKGYLWKYFEKIKNVLNIVESGANTITLTQKMLKNPIYFNVTWFMFRFMPPKTSFAMPIYFDVTLANQETDRVVMKMCVKVILICLCFYIRLF